VGFLSTASILLAFLLSDVPTLAKVFVCNTYEASSDLHNSSAISSKQVI
jgi:hypothetical protein